MEQVQVEILTQTITAQYGTLEVGTTLRTNTAFAEHLVVDCMAAKYSEPRDAKANHRTDAPVAGVDGDVQTSAQREPGWGRVTIEEVAPTEGAAIAPAPVAKAKAGGSKARKPAAAPSGED